MRKETLSKLQAAAGIFVLRGGCSAQHIADALDVPLNSVYHYAKHDEWQEALDTLNYTGERNFKIKPHRESRKERPLVEHAESIYTQAIIDGLTHTKAVTAVVKTIGETDALRVHNLRRRINRWAEKHGWSAKQ